MNDCGYCQDAYTRAAKEAGFDDEQAEQIRRGALDGDTVRTIVTNYFNHFVDTEQDVPTAPAL